MVFGAGPENKHMGSAHPQFHEVVKAEKILGTVKPEKWNSNKFAAAEAPTDFVTPGQPTKMSHSPTAAPRHSVDVAGTLGSA